MSFLLPYVGQIAAGVIVPLITSALSSWMGDKNGEIASSLGDKDGKNIPIGEKSSGGAGLIGGNGKMIRTMF